MNRKQYIKMQEVVESYDRLALWFRIAGDLKYISHRDTMRMWQRALTRADLPVRFSQGFNPHMRLSLPLPRSVGVASERELLVVEMAGAVDLTAAVKAINRTLPGDTAVYEAGFLPGRTAPQPLSAAYEITIKDAAEVSELRRRAGAFMAAESYVVERAGRGRHPRRSFDIRPGVQRMEINETERDVPGVKLTCRIGIGTQGTVRIDEILNATGVQEAAELEIVRTNVDYALS